MPMKRGFAAWLLVAVAAAQGQGSPVPAPAPTPTIYLGATLIDGTGAPAQPAMAIVVRGERIESVQPAAGFVAPAGAEVVRMHGRFLLPGLVDTHVHLTTPPDRDQALAMLRRQLYSGVTAVRDMAGDTRLLAELARAARLAEVAAPDFDYPALFAGPGFFEDPRVQMSTLGETAGKVPWMREIGPGTDLAEAVTLARGTGARAIKIYANLEAGTVAAITAEAHRQGLLVWAHGGVFPASPLAVAQAGADSLSHVCMLAYQGQAMPGQYHARPAIDEARFAGALPAEVGAVFAEMKARGAVLDATLFVYDTIERMRAELPEGQGPPTYCSSTLAKRLTREAHARGVEISAGTDAPSPPDDPYPAIQREIELLVGEAGMTPLQAIRSATLIGARSLGREDEMGTIAPGKLANLVFVASDPTRDIRALRQVELTVKRGKPYPRSNYRHGAVHGQGMAGDEAGRLRAQP